MRKFGYLAVGAAALALSVGTANAAPKTNMLHQWAAGADAAAIAKLGEMYTAAGGVWEQTAIAGHTANTLAKLRADVIAGNAPPAVQLKGPEIAEWNETGGTANLDELAAAEGWDKVVAPELLPVMKPDGALGRRADEHPPHQLAVGEQERARRRRHHRAAEDLGGVQCRLRQGRRRRQHLHRPSQRRLDATPRPSKWSSTARTSTSSARPSSRAMSMRCAARAWSRPSTQMRTMVSKYMDPAIAGRDYDSASRMMANGEAGFFIMGDWEIGTLTRPAPSRARTILCGQAPTDWGKPGFILNSDSVVFFKQKDPEYIEGQKLLAKHDPLAGVPDDLQPGQGLDPGAARRRSLAGLQPCQQTAQKDLQASIEAGTLVRSMAHNMTVLQKYPRRHDGDDHRVREHAGDVAGGAANAMADNVEAQM